MIYIIIGIIILILVLILLSFLLIPLKISLHLNKHGSQIKGRFSLYWIGIRFFSKKIPEEEKEEDKKKKKEKKEKAEKEEEKGKFDLKRILKIINLFLDAWPHLYRVLVAIVRSFTLEKFSLNLTMGMESPADTALFTGYIWSFTYPLNALTGIEMVITPDFQRRVLDGELKVEVRLKLIGIVTEAIRAYMKKPVRQFISEIRSLS
ncbi:MAG: DUF2953 domain-containing protein [Methanobacterium sp.]|nr:DUF2953 domain-containing protein [Methanobacterium sp.]